MTVQSIDSSDFQTEITPSSPANATGAKVALYTPPVKNGIQHGADIKDFQVRVHLPSKPQIDLDWAAWSELDEIAQRQALQSAIYDESIGFISLRIYRERAGTSVLLLDFPLFNSGLPSQVIKLHSYFPDGTARLSYGSTLSFALINTGSDGLLGGDYLQIWGTAIEEAWTTDPELVGLSGAVTAQASQLSAVIQSYSASLSQAINQQNQVLGQFAGILAIQNQSISALRDLIGKLSTVTPGGGSPPQSNGDNSTMHILQPISGSFGSANLPTPSTPVPATLGGFETKANQTVVFYSPWNDAYNIREYQAVYALIQDGAALKYQPLTRTSTQFYDGGESQFYEYWNGTAWVQVSRA